MQMQVLTIHHYGETAAEDRRLTIAPGNVVVLAAAIDDVQLQGRSVRKVTVMFMDSANVDVAVNHQDLELLERAVGSFFVEID